MGDGEGVSPGTSTQPPSGHPVLQSRGESEGRGPGRPVSGVVRGRGEPTEAVHGWRFWKKIMKTW